MTVQEGEETLEGEILMFWEDIFACFGRISSRMEGTSSKSSRSFDARRSDLQVLIDFFQILRPKAKRKSSSVSVLAASEIFFTMMRPGYVN